MRIATFNLESLDLPLDGRLAVLRPCLERLAADVLCLQEINAQRVPGHQERKFMALDKLLEGTRYAAFHRSWSRLQNRPSPADVHNLVTLSRFPILSDRQLQHDLVPPPPSTS